MDGNDRYRNLRNVYRGMRPKRAAVATAVDRLTPPQVGVLAGVLLLAGALVVSFLFVAAPASAAPGAAPGAAVQVDCSPEVVVTSSANDGPGSLRQALRDVCAGGIVRLDELAGQTVALSSTLAISQSVTLRGAAPGGEQPVLSGGDTVRVLEVRGRGRHVTLEGLTVANGQVSDSAVCLLYFFQRIFCGAGLLVDQGNFVTVTHSTFRDNHVTGVGRGAGILATASQLIVQDVRFENNRTDQNLGGAIYLEGGSLSIARSQFINNQALSGAGLFSGQSAIHQPVVTVTDSVFSGNQAQVYGGGIALGHARVTIRGSTFDNNQAGTGAALQINGVLTTSPGSTSAIIENNTFSTNQGAGGNVVHIYNEDVLVRSNTFAGNMAAAGRAAVEILPADAVRFENNLLSDNTADCRLLAGGPIASQNNLFASPGGLTCGAAEGVAGNRVGGPAYIGALGSYGGPTPTIPILPGSRAHEAGEDCAPVDQRGVTRPRPGGTACDIGAFESHGFHLTVQSGGRQMTRVTTLFPFPLGVRVTPVNPIEPVDGGAVTFTVPAAGASAALNSNPVIIQDGLAAPQATANNISASYQVRAAAAGAPEQPVFHLTNSFQVLIFDQQPDDPQPQFSDTKTTTTPCGTPFLGEFGNQTVTLTLPGLPAHAQALVTFDLFILKSWDGNQVSNTPELRQATGGLAPDLIVGPDRWRFDAAGVTMLDTSFSNWVELGFRQAYPGVFGKDDYPSQTGAEQVNSLCYIFSDRPLDAVYRMAYFIDHGETSLQLDFTGIGLQSLEDESWGLSNVKVTVANPSFLQLFAPIVNR